MIDKYYLRLHAEHREELEDELRRYELLRGSSYYNSPSNIDGMPRALYGSGDTTVISIVDKADTETNINKLETLVTNEEREIEEVIKLLPRAIQKTVIRIKYYNRYDWDDVALFIFGDKRDYVNNQEKYRKKAQKIHGNAICNMIRIQEKESID